MTIVRMISVIVQPELGEQAESTWKNHCAPLMIKQQGCLSEKLLKCTDAAGEFISYSEWEDQESIDKYRVSEAHQEILNHTKFLQGEKPVVKRYKII